MAIPVVVAAPLEAIGRPTTAARLINFKPAPRAGSVLFGYCAIDFGGLDGDGGP